MKTVEQLIMQSLTTAESETHAQFHTQILRIRLLLFFTVKTRNRKSYIQL